MLYVWQSPPFFSLDLKDHLIPGELLLINHLLQVHLFWLVMENCRLLLPLSLVHLLCINQIAANQPSLSIDNKLRTTQTIGCVYESHLPPVDTELTAERKSHLVKTVHLASMQETALPTPQTDDKVVCEIHVEDESVNQDIPHTKSALLFYEKLLGTGDVKWSLRDDGMYIKDTYKVFNWTNNSVFIWPTSLAWNEAATEGTFDRLTRMFSQVSYIEKDACRIDNEIQTPWVFNCLHSSSIATRKIELRQSRSKKQLRRYEIPANSRGFSMPISLFDEAVVCGFAIWNGTVNSSFSKFALLYHISQEPFLWSFKQEGLFLSGENDSKFGWYDNKILGWPPSLWSINPAFSVYQILHRLLSNFQVVHRFVKEKNYRVNETPLSRKIIVVNTLSTSANLRCLGSAAMVQNQNGQPTDQRSQLVQQYVIQPGSDESLPRDTYVVCRIDVMVSSGHQQHSTKYALLYFPTRNRFVWALKSQGLFLDEESQSKFQWNDSEIRGWPPALWYTNPYSSVAETVDTLLSNYLAYIHYHNAHREGVTTLI